MEKTAQEIKHLETKDLIPYARNSRTHDEYQVNQIVSSIKEFGFTNPILVDDDNSIIAGHGRLMAAQKLGLTKVPTINLGYLSDSQKKAYVIADNKLALNAGWDIDMLKLEIDELNEIDFNVDILGFTDDELKNILADKNDGLVDEDQVPELQDDFITKPGDLWILGEHRLFCGDATVDADVNKLMDGRLADLVFTDPPYNVDYSGGRQQDMHKKEYGKIKNDAMTPQEFDTFIADSFANYYSYMKPLACIFVCHPDSVSAAKITFEVEFSKLFKKSANIIWDKGNAGLGYQDYRAQHEPILFGWKEGDGAHYFIGARDKTTIWRIQKDSATSYVHATQKPVALIEEAILNHSKGSDIVVDLFGGSGSTLLGCEKNGRICHTMELDPQYCDVIIRRYQDYTGKEAKLIDGDSQTTFKELENERDKTTSK